MFITDRKLKEMVGQVLKEVAYSEPFSGNLAYFIVNFLAADRLKKYIAPHYHEKTPFIAMKGYEIHKFDFTKTFEDHLRKEKPSFLPLSTKERAYPSGRPVAVSMFDNHHRNLKNGFEYIKKTLARDLGPQFANRSRKKMLDQWSGLLFIRIREGHGQNQLTGAAFSVNDNSLNLEMEIDREFMTRALGAGQEPAYRDYKNLMQEIKHTMVHELVHSKQSETQFKGKTLQPGENEIQRHIRSNYFGYSDIDKTIFPKIGALQDYLKKRIIDHYDSVVSTYGQDVAYVSFDGLRDGITSPLAPAKIYQMYFYSRVIAQLFSPEEVEAYVRGYRSEEKAKEYGVGFTKKDGGADNFYRQIERNIEDRLHTRFDDFLHHGIREMNISNEPGGPNFTLDDYWEDMVEGYIEVYKNIFG